jgi:hypothetical protein
VLITICDNMLHIKNWRYQNVTSNTYRKVLQKKADMKTEKSEIIIAEEIIISKIYNIRGKQVMLASDLAELYQVETRALNQQVKRNIGKFTDRYMFQLTKDEYDRIRSQNVILKRGHHVKYLPLAFTEHGILMLSSVLNSERAEKVSMLIIDTFVRLREILWPRSIAELSRSYKEFGVPDSSLSLLVPESLSL